jgi:protein TonB
MTAHADIAHADILDQRDPVRGSFVGAVALHAAIFGGLAIHTWWQGSADAFGAPNAGGIVGIQAVNSIPLPHRGMPNPVANDTPSQVPQQPAPPKPVEKIKQTPPSPKAVPLKSKTKQAPTPSQKQRFRPFEELDPNQVTARQAPQVSNPAFSAMQGSGRVGTGARTTLGTRFAGYGAQIQELVAQKWRTSDVDARIQSAPLVVATFDLMRNGSVRNVQILQRSGISSLDFSVQRAILEASPFPPIPAGFDRDYAKVEFTFELKR